MHSYESVTVYLEEAYCSETHIVSVPFLEERIRTETEGGVLDIPQKLVVIHFSDIQHLHIFHEIAL